MPEKIPLRVIVHGYWTDLAIKKAYCVVEYVDFKEDEKHTNMYLIESDYDGK